MNTKTLLALQDSLFIPRNNARTIRTYRYDYWSTETHIKIFKGHMQMEKPHMQ